MDGSHVAAKDLQVPAAFRVPEPDGLVDAGRGQEVPGRRIGHGEDLAVVTAQKAGGGIRQSG